MSLDMKCIGRVVFIGWEEADEDMGHDRRFIAKITFDDGAPSWPMSVVLGNVPVELSLRPADHKKDPAP